MAIFAVVYQGFIPPNAEEDYQKCWKIIATYFVNKCGALSSTLHKTENGLWLGYSRWPDKATRDAAWPRNVAAINSKFPLEVREAIIKMQSYIEVTDSSMKEICMEVREEIYKK